MFWPFSDDKNSLQGDSFQVWQMWPPLPEKWVMIRCVCGDRCRRWTGPQRSNESALTLSDEYIGWIMMFRPSSEDKNSPQGDPFQVWQMQLPLPALERIRIDNMQFISLHDSRVTSMMWMQPGNLRQMRERWWHLEAATPEFFQDSS